MTELSGSELLLNGVFYGFAFLLLVCAVGVAASKNIIRSAFWLLGVLFTVSALYALMKADFLFVTQILVYVGGILILIVFAVMLTHRISDVNVSNESASSPIALVAVACTVGIIIIAVFSYKWQSSAWPPDIRQTKLVGEALMGEYILPFEVMSVLLLAALIAAIYFVRKEIKR